MANTIDFILTNAASKLISKVLSGKTINFTRMAVGDGFSYDTTAAKDYTALVNEVLSLDITKKETLTASSVRITSAFKNTDAQQEFYYREVGLFAEDPDTGEEVLYAYGNRNDAAELITPTGSSVITKQLSFIISVGKSANITFSVNADVYALQEDLTTLQTTLNDLNRTKANLYCIDVKNPPVGFTPAIGDGNTDDSQAINTMLEYCLKNHYDIYFPASTYLGNFVIKLPDDTDTSNSNSSQGGINIKMKIYGDGERTILTSLSGITLFVSGNDTIANSLRSISINNITLDGSNNNVLGMYFYRVQNFRLDNIFIWNCKNGGIKFEGAMDGKISKVDMIGCGRAVSDTDYAYALEILSLIGVQTSNALTFEQCRIEVSPCIIHNSGSADQIYFSNCKFEKSSINLLATHRPIRLVAYANWGFNNCIFGNNSTTSGAGYVDDGLYFIYSNRGDGNSVAGANIYRMTNCDFVTAPNMYCNWLKVNRAIYDKCSFNGCYGAGSSTYPIILDGYVDMITCKINLVSGCKAILCNGSYCNVSCNVKNMDNIWNTSIFYFGSGEYNHLEFNIVDNMPTANYNTLYLSDDKYSTSIANFRSFKHSFISYKTENVITTSGYVTLQNPVQTVIMESGTFAGVYHTYDGYKLTLIAKGNVSVVTEKNIVLKNNTSVSLSAGDTISFVCVSGILYQV